MMIFMREYDALENNNGFLARKRRGCQNSRKVQYISINE